MDKQPFMGCRGRCVQGAPYPATFSDEVTSDVGEMMFI